MVVSHTFMNLTISSSIVFVFFFFLQSRWWNVFEMSRKLGVMMFRGFEDLKDAIPKRELQFLIHFG